MIRPPPKPPLFPSPPLSRSCALLPEPLSRLYRALSRRRRRMPGAAERRRRWLGQIGQEDRRQDRKSTRLNSSHSQISYAVFCLKKKKNKKATSRPTQKTHTI